MSKLVRSLYCNHLFLIICLLWSSLPRKQLKLMFAESIVVLIEYQSLFFTFKRMLRKSHYKSDFYKQLKVLSIYI